MSRDEIVEKERVEKECENSKSASKKRESSGSACRKNRLEKECE